MLCYPFEEKRLKKWGFPDTPVFAQPKFDGDRCRAVVSGGDAILYSSECNERPFLIHIKHALVGMVARAGMTHAELDGELYIHGEGHELIHSITSRTVNMHPDEHLLQYHIFDIITDEPQHQRFMRLVKMFDTVGPNYPLKLAGLFRLYNMDEIIRHMDWFVSQGYEGIIIRKIDGLYKRKRSTDIMKFKPHLQIEAQIVDVVEGEGRCHGTLGAVVCHMPSDPFKICTVKTFNAGTGPILTDYGRRLLWQERDRVIGGVAIIKYQNTTNGGVPRFPVLVDVIAEGRTNGYKQDILWRKE